MFSIEDISVIKGLSLGIEYTSVDTLEEEFEDEDFPENGLIVIDFFILRFIIGLN